IGNLSKGYRQRVALADALIHRPPLLILDEPTNGLDPTQIRGVRDMLRALKSQHTILLSTHILHEVELICDRVIMIHHGRIRACDAPRNLTQQLRTATTVQLQLQGNGKVITRLEELPGVRKVTEDAADGQWRILSIRVESQHDVREAIIDLATREHWRI